jgi:DnaJ-class molecular chaperone
MDGDRQQRAREIARKSGMNLKCAYDILCLDYPCSADDIKSAYRRMARVHHPDLGGDEEAMKDVNVAYELAMRFCSGARRTSTAWAV